MGKSGTKFKYTHNMCKCMGYITNEGSSVGCVGLWLLDDFTIKPKIGDEIEYMQSEYGDYLWVKVNGILAYELTKKLKDKYYIEDKLQAENTIKSTRERLGISK